jgi:hypothetical protein
VTPERAEMILDGVLRSLQLFLDDLEDLETTCPCPEVRHLKQAVGQMRTSLEQLIARS